MIIGKGLMAKAFEDYANYDDIVLFASGVSNSKETLKSEFLREESLLKDIINKFGNNRRIIYFSTCSMYDTYSNISDYTKHKIRMESVIAERANKYNIFRLPQVLGKNNKNQLIGFLYEKIKNKKAFEVLNIERNIIDVEDVYLIASTVLKESKKNEIINIANIKNDKVIDLVTTLEKICKEKGRYSIKNIEGDLDIDISQIKPLILEKKIFEKKYLINRIRKYYE
jgi:nucleoside-diphosphate-sugar epimerase